MIFRILASLLGILYLFSAMQVWLNSLLNTPTDVTTEELCSPQRPDTIDDGSFVRFLLPQGPFDRLYQTHTQGLRYTRCGPEEIVHIQNMNTWSESLEEYAGCIVDLVGPLPLQSSPPKEHARDVFVSEYSVPADHISWRRSFLKVELPKNTLWLLGPEHRGEARPLEAFHLHNHFRGRLITVQQLRAGRYWDIYGGLRDFIRSGEHVQHGIYQHRFVENDWLLLSDAPTPITRPEDRHLIPLTTDPVCALLSINIAEENKVSGASVVARVEKLENWQLNDLRAVGRMKVNGNTLLLHYQGKRVIWLEVLELLGMGLFLILLSWLPVRRFLRRPSAPSN